MSIEGMDALNRRLEAITDHRQLLGTVGLLAVRYAKEIVPRKTGNLGRTIRLGTVTETNADIIAGGSHGVGYARAVEFGTKPHPISPKPGRTGRNGRPAMLAWGGNRRLSGSLRSGASPTVFRRSVNHPGTQPKPYLRPAAERAVRETGVEGIVKAWNEAA